LQVHPPSTARPAHSRSSSRTAAVAKG